MNMKYIIWDNKNKYFVRIEVAPNEGPSFSTIEIKTDDINMASEFTIRNCHMHLNKDRYLILSPHSL